MKETPKKAVALAEPSPEVIDAAAERPLDGEQRDCLDCHGTLEYDGDTELWHHVSEGGCK